MFSDPMDDWRPADMKLCSQCGQWKPFDAFTKDANQSSGFRPNCKECHRKYTKWYAKKNAEQANARAKKWHREHPGWAVQRSREWRKNHPEEYKAQVQKYRQKNRKKINAYKLARAKAHPESRSRTLSQYGAKRKARIGVNVENVTREEVLARSGNKCYLCQKPLTLKTLCVEHDIPLSRGGAHDYENVHASCRRCNTRKSTKTAAEYRELLANKQKQAA